MKIKFNDGTGIKFGTPIGKHMAILSESNGYAIYKIVPSTRGRGKFMNTIFASLDTAERYGQYIDTQFRPYIPIWDILGDADPVAWAKWHSPKHLMDYCVFSMLNLVHQANKYPMLTSTNFVELDSEFEAIMICLKQFLLHNPINLVTIADINNLVRSPQTKKLYSWWSRNKNWDHQVKGALGVV